MFNFKGTPLKYGYAVIKTNKGIIKYTLKRHRLKQTVSSSVM